MQLKAISPMIAVILLIAFTVAIGGILSVWLTSVTQTQTSTAGSYAEKVAKCAGVSLNIENITPITSNQITFQVSHESGTYDSWGTARLLMSYHTIDDTTAGGAGTASVTFAIRNSEVNVWNCSTNELFSNVLIVLLYISPPQAPPNLTWVSRLLPPLSISVDDPLK